jgi:hypothetical protein
MSASSLCASGIASEYLPALLSSAISALRAAAFCADDGVAMQLIAASANYNDGANRWRDFMECGLYAAAATRAGMHGSRQAPRPFKFATDDLLTL